MRLTLKTAGGHVRLPPRTLDAAALPDDALHELRGLVDRAAAAPPPPPGPGAARDAFSYTLQVEDGGQAREIRSSDADMSDAFADLLDWFQRHTT